jgi:hypothetical protein
VSKNDCAARRVNRARQSKATQPALPARIAEDDKSIRNRPSGIGVNRSV